MLARSAFARTGALFAAISLIILVCQLLLASPGVGYRCFTFNVPLNAECGCPISGDPPHESDFCSNTRPNLWQSDGTSIYLPYCMLDYEYPPPDPPPECHEPVFGCGGQIWRCNIVCTGEEEPVTVLCELTSKPSGCGGSFGCAGSPGAPEGF